MEMLLFTTIFFKYNLHIKKVHLLKLEILSNLIKNETILKLNKILYWL